MKILMMTNSYAPMVGGIEESIRSFSAEFEKLGHEVMIVAPECEGAPLDEVGVIRLRAIQNFNNTNFSIALPLSSLLPELIKTFKPDIIHSHYPFWMGSIAKYEHVEHTRQIQGDFGRTVWNSNSCVTSQQEHRHEVFLHI